MPIKEGEQARIPDKLEIIQPSNRISLMIVSKNADELHISIRCGSWRSVEEAAQIC